MAKTDVDSKKKAPGNWDVEVEEKKHGGEVHKRRFVRLDITSPVEIKLLVKPENENQEPGLIPFKGEVLNVSAGGVLIESEDAVPEDNYVIMEFELNNTDRISGIVGKVKRCDSEEESIHLIGVEFCTREEIDANCPKEYMPLIGEQCLSFTEKVRELLDKYVFSEKVKNQPGEAQK